MADSFLEELITLTLDSAHLYTDRYGSLKADEKQYDPSFPFGSFSQRFHRWNKAYQKDNVTLNLTKEWVATAVGESDNDRKIEDSTTYTFNYISSDKQINASRVITKTSEGKNSQLVSQSDSCWQIHQGLEHLPALVEFIFVHNPRYTDRIKKPTVPTGT